MAKVQDKPFFCQRGRLEKATSPFFNEMKWGLLVDHKAAVVAEHTSRDTVLASKKSLLGLAHRAQHISRWLSLIQNF